MSNKVLIICESFYNGNTMKLAKAMGNRLYCDIVSPAEASKADLAQYDVIGLGSGIYFTSHHPEVIRAAKNIKPHQRAFIFSTHGRPYLGNYHDSLKKVLTGNGVEIIGELSTKGFDCTGPFIIVGGGNKGKPDLKDEHRAASFASTILPQYATDQCEKSKGRYVRVSALCKGCGKCVKACPMKVFGLTNGISTAVNEDDCIHCSICRKVCPQNAITIRHGFFDAIHIAKRHKNRVSL